MKYFQCDKTESAIRKQYRDLCKVHHPDIGGDESIMKAINAEYDELLRSVDGECTVDNSGKKHYYKYDAETEKNIVNMMRKIQNLRLPADIEIGLIGTWLWVIGNTKPFKDQLKFIGLRYHSAKECWYWHGGVYRGSRGRGSFQSMAWKYGYSKIANSMKDSGKYIN